MTGGNQFDPLPKADPEMTDDDARGRQNFTLRHRKLSIAPADICTATRDVLPTTPIDGRYKYFVELHGRRFPIKQVIRLVIPLVTGSPPWGFGATSAKRILLKLGFDVIDDHGSGRRRRGAAARRS